MRIVHIELAGFYNENMSYQTNMLVKQNCKDGHQVLIISSNYQWCGAQIQRVPAGESMTDEGARLIRVPYFPSLENFILHKVRYARGVYNILKDFGPDVILSHSLAYWSVRDAIRYKKEHPEVRFYADTHTAYENSGTNWLSRHILHQIFYRSLVQLALPYLEKYWYIGIGEKKFSQEVYGVPESRMECYPLGGELFPRKVYEEKRNRRRAELGLAQNEILLVHTGKLGPLKRTAELLQAFSNVHELKARLIIIGAIPEETKTEILTQIDQDYRVEYLGWKNADDLMEYLCACDLYCQPGSGSATLQNAICCGCPVVAFPIDSYVELLDCGQFFWVQTQNDMEEVFRKIAEDTSVLLSKTEKAWECAREVLDYRKLAARLYQ